MRVFFALDLVCPWKDSEPPGRYIEKPLRHITLLFAGEIENDKISKIISSIPKPSFTVGPSGIFDKVLALPFHHPNVVAYRGHLISRFQDLKKYKTELIAFLENSGIFIKTEFKDFIPHATLCRRPFVINLWKKKFSKLPFFMSKINLYESLGNSNYKSLWSHNLILPFSEIDHTADIAFHIRGEDFFQLYANGFIALCFHCEQMCDYFLEYEKIENIDDVIMSLNKIITSIDIDIGSPFKAVSFQSNVEEKENYLEWEMIVDV